MDDRSGVRFTMADGVATLTLNRAEVGNALDLPTATSFRICIDRISANPAVGAILINAAGRHFCVGGDVAAMAGAADRGQFVAELAGVMHQALERLRILPVPVIAAVQGPVAGAGLGIVLSADLVVAADTAEFVAAYGAIGLSPDCGVSALLPALVGPRRAALLMLTNRRLTADDAFAWGLVSEICPAGDVAGRSNALAREVADRPGRAAGETARLLRAANDRGYAAQPTAELATISRLSTSPAAGALIAQFAAARPAPEATA